MLTEEQAKQIKEQLFKQIETLPESQRDQIKKQVEAMNAKQLEEFLKKQQVMAQQQAQPEQQPTGEASGEQQCIFCLISEGKVPVHKINENKQALAVLEINPASKGHVIVVSKKHISSDKVPTTMFSLAKKIAKRIKTKLKPKRVDITTSEMQGHGGMNVLPVYNNETVFSERKKASESELKELEKKLEKKKIETLKPKIKKTRKLEEAPKRFP